ncbi:hypothetical protein BU15DRAFT_65557 [Melanogaster broomeanus]|nr:hypothetical protein BU15DRAFT_65557 [Melanogaster broomeanus]
MARTKQTAQKTTGGIAPRVPIMTSIKSTTVPTVTQQLTHSNCDNTLKPHASSPVTNETGDFVPAHQKDGAQPNGRRACLDQMLSVPSCWDTRQNNDFCHLCGDGGQMYMCDRCPRSACQKSITLSPEDRVLVTAPGVRYLCVSCHLMDDKTEGTGFYLNGKPALARFPKVHGCPELSTKSFIHSTPTIIVHLRLKSIPLAGPMNMLSDFLEQYFPSGDGLTMIDLKFDLGTAVKRKAYLQVASKTALQVQEANARNVLFTISNHTDQDTGDLFLGELRRRNVLKVGKPCATWCAVAFDASRLQPLVTWPFLVHLTEAIFIEGHTIDDAVPHALAQSTRLGQHSGVYIMTLAPAASSNLRILNTTKYIWSHRDYRPWGKPLPLQCPQCGTLSNGCRYHRCGWDEDTKAIIKRPATFKFKKPADAEVLPQGKGQASSWLRFCLAPKVVDMTSEPSQIASTGRCSSFGTRLRKIHFFIPIDHSLDNVMVYEDTASTSEQMFDNTFLAQ